MPPVVAVPAIATEAWVGSIAGVVLGAAGSAVAGVGLATCAGAIAERVSGSAAIRAPSDAEVSDGVGAGAGPTARGEGAGDAVAVVSEAAVAVGATAPVRPTDFSVRGRSVPARVRSEGCCGARSLS